MLSLPKSFYRNCTFCLARRSQGKEVHSNKQRQTSKDKQQGCVAFLVTFLYNTMYYIFLVLWLLLIWQLGTSAAGSGEVIPFVLLSENIPQIKICEVC